MFPVVNENGSAMGGRGHPGDMMHSEASASFESVQVSRLLTAQCEPVTAVFHKTITGGLISNTTTLLIVLSSRVGYAGRARDRRMQNTEGPRVGDSHSGRKHWATKLI